MNIAPLKIAIVRLLRLIRNHDRLTPANREAEIEAIAKLFTSALEGSTST
jgi:hypothetical protein